MPLCRSGSSKFLCIKVWFCYRLIFTEKFLFVSAPRAVMGGNFIGVHCQPFVSRKSGWSIEKCFDGLWLWRYDQWLNLFCFIFVVKNHGSEKYLQSGEQAQIAAKVSSIVWWNLFLSNNSNRSKYFNLYLCTFHIFQFCWLMTWNLPEWPHQKLLEDLTRRKETGQPRGKV